MEDRAVAVAVLARVVVLEVVVADGAVGRAVDHEVRADGDARHVVLQVRAVGPLRQRLLVLLPRVHRPVDEVQPHPVRDQHRRHAVVQHHVVHRRDILHVVHRRGAPVKGIEPRLVVERSRHVERTHRLRKRWGFAVSVRSCVVPPRHGVREERIGVCCRFLENTHQFERLNLQGDVCPLAGGCVIDLHLLLFVSNNAFVCNAGICRAKLEQNLSKQRTGHNEGR